MAIKIDIPGFGEVNVEGAAQEDTMQAILAAVNKSDKSKAAEEKKLKKANEEAAKSAEKMATGLDEAVESAKKSDRETKARNKKLADDAKKASKDAIAQVGNFGVSLAATAASVATSMIKNIDANAENPIALGAGLINTSLDMVGSALKIGVDVVSSFTGALAGAIPVIGGGAQRLNDGLANVAKEVIDFGIAVAKAANDFMAAEFEKTAASMKAMTGAGASFAGGMTELRQTANDSGVGLTVFTKVVQNSQNYLHNFGITSSESTTLVAAGMKTLATTTRTVNGVQMKARDQLLNLGYSYEEQGEIMAQYMVSQKQAGKNLKDMTPKELTDGVLEYAKNLKVISDITGKDAKKLMEKAQAESMRGAISAKLDEKQRASFQQSFAGMMSAGDTLGPKLQTALEQMLAGGTVTDPVIAGNKQLMEMIQKTTGQVMSGTADMAGKTRDNIVSASKQFSAVGESATSTAKLFGANGVAGDMGEVNDVMRNLAINSETAGKASNDAANAQLSTTDKVSQDFAKASDQAAKFGVAMEKIATENMAAYADVLVLAIGTTQTAIQDGIAASLDFKKWAKSKGEELTGPSKAKGEEEKFGEKAGGFAGMWAGAALGAGIGGAAGLGVGAIPGALVGGALGLWGGYEAGGAAGKAVDNSGKPGKAKGGIASGPLSGYQELLHGTEAVVPLPDGKSIPVSLDSSSLNASIQQQTAILNGILAAMNKNNHLSSGILQNSY